MVPESRPPISHVTHSFSSERHWRLGLAALALAPDEAPDERGWRELCRGNLYSTTLHLINSTVVKMSRLTKVQTVYPGKDILAARCTYNSTDSKH